jgi:hypothetical protein
LPFVLGYGSEQMQRQPIGLGEIGYNEFNAAVHQ